MKPNSPTIYDTGAAGSAIPSVNSAPQQSAPVQSAVKQPSWWERILPTAGSVVGGIAGTLASPIIGSGIGAGLGGALGQDIENHLTGSKTGTLGTGIEDAVGGAAGGALGSGVGAVLGKVVSPLADSVVPSLIVKQSGDMLDHDTAQYLAQNGLTNFQDAVKAGQQITGATGGDGAALSNTVQDAVDNASKTKVDLTNEGQNWTSPLQSYPGISVGTKNSIGGTVKNIFSQMAQDSGYNVDKVAQKGGNILDVADPEAISNTTPGAAMTASKSLRTLANAVGNGARDPSGTIINADKAAAQDTYNNLASAIEQKTLGVNVDGTQTIPFGDGERDILKQSISGLQTTNPQLFQTLSKGIDDAQSWSDVRSLQQPFVKVSQANSAMLNAANKAPGVGSADVAGLTGGLAGGLGPKGILGTAVGLATKSKAADAGLAGTLSRLADTTSGGDTMASPSTIAKALGVKNANAGLVNKVIPLATRASVLGAANLPNIDESSVASPLASTNVNQNSTIPTGANMQQPQNPLAQLYGEILAQSQSPTGISGNLISTADSIAPQLEKQQLGAPVISSIENQFANAGGAQGTGGGLLSRLTGLIPGTAANTYQSQQSSAAAQLSQLLGISPEQAQSLLPQLMQNSQSASGRLGVLNSMLGNIGGTTPSAIPTQ